MTTHVRFIVALLAIGAGCAQLEIEPAEELGEVSSELSVTSWSPPVKVTESHRGGIVATLNGVTYMVRGECCDVSTQFHDLAWLKRTATGAWTPSVIIPNQGTTGVVSLAAFNGYLYMLASGHSGSVYMSRFDPATSVWSASWSLPYKSYVAPALVVFQNKLWLIGNTLETTHQLWAATMTTDEVFSLSVLLPGQYSGARVSAAVFKSRLYLVHKQLASTAIVYSRFDGTSWTPNQFIYAGVNGAPIRGAIPALAAVNGYLHLVYGTKWSYFDGCVWSLEVSIPGPSFDFNMGLSLTQGGPGLVRTSKVNSASDYGVYVTEFTAPPAPILPPSCGGIGT